MIQLEAFKQDFSTGAGFFSIDSYPIDDTGVTANSIYTQDLPIYYSAALQGPVNLRNSVDFRPYVSNTIPYCNSSLAVANTLILNPANTFSLVTTNLMMPIVDGEFISSLQYYMGRYDQIGLSNSGQIIVNSGIPSLNPYPPSPVTSGLTLALISVPPYPSLTPDNSDIPPGYPTVGIKYNSLKRYTMADIGNIDAQVQQLQYYSVLNLLEQSTQNLLLTNESGQTAFQNGFLADPMQDFSIANTLAPGFNIAIDASVPEARPVFSNFPLNMVLNAFTNDNVQQSTDGNNDVTSLITLDYNEAILISQQYACGIPAPPAQVANTIPTPNTVANTPANTANTPSNTVTISNAVGNVVGILTLNIVGTEETTAGYYLANGEFVNGSELTAYVNSTNLPLAAGAPVGTSLAETSTYTVGGGTATYIISQPAAQDQTYTWDGICTLNPEGNSVPDVSTDPLISFVDNLVVGNP